MVFQTISEPMCEISDKKNISYCLFNAFCPCCVIIHYILSFIVSENVIYFNFVDFGHKDCIIHCVAILFYSALYVIKDKMFSNYGQEYE